MIQKSLFKNKNYYLLMGYQLSNGIADKLFQFCIPWFVYDLTDSAAQMTLTFGMSMIPYLLFNFLGGALIDCFNRRKILLITSALSSITLLIFSILFFKESTSMGLGVIYALAFLLSTYNAFDRPAFDSSVIEYFKTNELVSINTTIEAIESCCDVIGPLVAGVSIHLFGSKTLLIATAVYLISFALIKISKPIQESSLNKKFEDIGELVYENCQLIKEGFAYLLRPDCPIALIAFTTFLYNIFYSPQTTLIVFLGRNKFDMSAEAFSSMISIISFVAIFCIILLSAKLRKMNPFSIMIAAMSVIAAAAICIGFAQSITFLAGFYAIIIIINSIYGIFARSLRLAIVPHSLTGRIASICSTLMYAGAGLGAIMSSIVLKFSNVSTFFIFSGISISIIATLAFRLYKKYILQTSTN